MTRSDSSAHDPTRRVASSDESFMQRAIELAHRGQGAVEPNPMVGCLLVRDGEIIGEGYHQQFGGPHAEVVAIRSLGGADAVGATAYVSLEPCCHHGKTPPCTDALIEAGVARVAVALVDPFSRVAGAGLKRLREAGIEVTTGLLEREAASLCAPYLKRVRRGRPWVIAKWAMTIDGKIATTSGESQWITSETSRADVHRLRGRVDAVAVGMGTVLADDPLLTARFSDPSAKPQRIARRLVFCRHRLPLEESRLVATARQFPLGLIVGPEVDRQHLQRLHSLGADVTNCQTSDLIQMVHTGLESMAAREMTNVLLEGGPELVASFFAADEIDECQVYVGAKAFGGAAAPGPIGGPGIPSLVDAPRFQFLACERFEDDIKLVYRRAAN